MLRNNIKEFRLTAKTSTIDDCRIIKLSKIQNMAGNITIVENGVHAPFNIKRVYYLYDVPGGEERGGHAHKKLHQYLIAASGAFEVRLTDGNNQKTVRLDRPYYSLHIVPGIWRELINFSSGAICLVLASELYSQSDYISEINKFRRFKKSKY